MKGCVSRMQLKIRDSVCYEHERERVMRCYDMTRE